VCQGLRFGVERLPSSRRREVIERYLEEVVLPAIPILAYDQRAADWHASERARLASSGDTPSFADGQIPQPLAFMTSLSSRSTKRTFAASAGFR
jgi:hypothetical protein